MLTTFKFKLRPTVQILRSPSRFIHSQQREKDNVDLLIVGAGPAGLAAAIRYKQLDTSNTKRVVVLEKAGEIGGHSLSGAIIEPRALNELIPNWRENMPPLTTLVNKDEMKFLTSKLSFPLPGPPQMSNKNKNYIVSMASFVRWLGERAEELDVEVYPGFSLNELLKNSENEIVGVATSDMGLNRSGKPKPNFERGMEFYSKVTLLGEGCHGNLSKQVIDEYKLREKVNADPTTYGLGIKEVWEVKDANFQSGRVAHSVGFPLSPDLYGGGFMYHFGNNLVSCGLVIGLDYANPYISPYEEFQKMKTHPFYKQVLNGGKCIAYGARALNEGGYQSLPYLNFPGGGLIGCSAGFMNVPKIKGSHTAMKSGMIAAELAYANEFEKFNDAVRNSWVGKELYSVRNVRPSFGSKLKLWGGLSYAGLDTMILRGNVPFTFHHKHSDAESTKLAQNYSEIKYPKHDNNLTFDLMTSVSRTGTYHSEDEPNHLKVPSLEMHARDSWPKYRGVEQRFCPAGVYEYVEVPGSKIPKFKINSQNCIHCKTCDIKTPKQDITWTCPEGGDGPKYTIT